MTGYPIRIAVRIDFSDGTEHDYEVRGADAVDVPAGEFWPEGVVTADVAGRMRLYQRMHGDIEALTADNALLSRNWHADRAKLVALREWARVNIGDSPRWEQVLEIFERDFREDEP